MFVYWNYYEAELVAEHCLHVPMHLWDEINIKLPRMQHESDMWQKWHQNVGISRHRSLKRPFKKLQP